MRSVLVAISLTISAVPAFACNVPSGWAEMIPAKETDMRAFLSAGEAGALLGKPFDIGIAVCTDGETSIDRVTVDATMPAHQHGMNYRPKISKTGAHAYNASGLLFHMPGLWRYSVKLFNNGDAPGDSLTFTLDVSIL